MDRLLTDGAVLRQLVLGSPRPEEAGADRNRRILSLAGDLLKTGWLPPASGPRSTGCSGMPGITVTDRNARPDGRRGVAFGITTDGGRKEVGIDPATGEFIGVREVCDLRAEGVSKVETGTVLSTSVTDKRGQEPR